MRDLICWGVVWVAFMTYTFPGVIESKEPSIRAFRCVLSWVICAIMGANIGCALMEVLMK